MDRNAGALALMEYVNACSALPASGVRGIENFVSIDTADFPVVVPQCALRLIAGVTSDIHRGFKEFLVCEDAKRKVSEILGESGGQNDGTIVIGFQPFVAPALHSPKLGGTDAAERQGCAIATGHHLNLLHPSVTTRNTAVLNEDAVARCHQRTGADQPASANPL